MLEKSLILTILVKLEILARVRKRNIYEDIGKNFFDNNNTEFCGSREYDIIRRILFKGYEF